MARLLFLSYQPLELSYLQLPLVFHREGKTHSGPLHLRVIRAVYRDEIKAFSLTGIKETTQDLGCPILLLLLLWICGCCSVLLQVYISFFVLPCCRPVKPFLP